MSVNGSAESVIELKGSLSLPDAIRGKDAYEIAVAHGFKGTVEEWLASLTGVGISQIRVVEEYDSETIYAFDFTDGSSFKFTVYNGKDGMNGADGENGEDGKNGIDGKDGEDGKTPYIQDGYWYIDGVNTNVKAQGADGKDGENGINGADGKDGAPGADGNDYVLTEADKEEIAQKSLGYVEKAVAIDLSNFDTNGQIVETYPSGTKTTTVEFDEDGNPIKITDGDGNEITLTW